MRQCTVFPQREKMAFLLQAATNDDGGRGVSGICVVLLTSTCWSWRIAKHTLSHDALPFVVADPDDTESSK
jgi:hypothetical protein